MRLKLVLQSCSYETYELDNYFWFYDNFTNRHYRDLGGIITKI